MFSRLFSAISAAIALNLITRKIDLFDSFSATKSKTSLCGQRYLCIYFIIHFLPRQDGYVEEKK
jgi:hypothetical protein